jgi:hypothetical protein
MACEISVCLYDRSRLPITDKAFEELVKELSEVRRGIEIKMPSGQSYTGVTLPGETRREESRIMVTMAVSEELLRLLNAGIRPVDMQTISCAAAEARLT